MVVLLKAAPQATGKYGSLKRRYQAMLHLQEELICVIATATAKSNQSVFYTRCLVTQAKGA